MVFLFAVMDSSFSYRFHQISFLNFDIISYRLSKGFEKKGDISIVSYQNENVHIATSLVRGCRGVGCGCVGGDEWVDGG